MIHFGYPQMIEWDALSRTLKLEESFAKEFEHGDRKWQLLANQVIEKFSQRKRSLKLKSNEVFIDVTETLNVLVTATGELAQSNAAGCIGVRCNLSNTAECNLALNFNLPKEFFGNSTQKSSSEKEPSKIQNRKGKVENCQFHSCVQYGKAQKQNEILFIPPEGYFELFRSILLIF
jgi:hypothetical protein